MNKTKIDFIIDLLSDRRLTDSQKEKLFVLSHRELKNLEDNDKIILNRLEQIEKKMMQEESPKAIDAIPSKEPPTAAPALPTYHAPNHIARLLNEFNTNLVLKSTSHEIDENLLENLLEELGIPVYSYETHIKRIEEEFAKLTALYKVNKGLIAKLNEYLFSTSKNGWSQDRIKIGWKSPDIINWCNENPGKCPNPGSDLNYSGCSLEEVVELKDGVILKNFNDVISRFKSQIEFRDGSDLVYIVKKDNDKYYREFKINTEKIKKGIRFYSDVEKVSQAYRNIIKICIEYWRDIGKPEDIRPEFELSLCEQRVEKGTKITFSIHHLNSIYGKTSSSLIDKQGNSISELIKNQINGLCDLVLKAEFPEKEYAEVSIWPGSNCANALDHFSGVQFNLIFYRLS